MKEARKEQPEPWLLPGQAPPVRISRWENEPLFSDAKNDWLCRALATSRVPYTDDELVAAHREAVAFAKKRRATDAGAQEFAVWCVARLPEGCAPEFWLLWKSYLGEGGETEATKADRLERRRIEAKNTAIRMGFAEYADDIASGVVERLLVNGEQPTRFAVIDYVRSAGFADEEHRGRPEPVLRRLAPEREELELRRLADEARSGISHDLRAVLDQLERHDRMVLLLHFRWGLNQLEIGDLFGFSESRANQYIKRALLRAQRVAKSKARKRALNALKIPNRKPRIGMIELDETPAPKPKRPEPPPFEVQIEDAVPLTEACKREQRPEIQFLLANMKPGQSAKLPLVLAKRLAVAVKKREGWKLAQRKTDDPNIVRVWRLEA